MSIRISAIRFPRTRSKAPGIADRGVVSARNTSATPFSSAFFAATSTATGSVSIARTRFAPRRAAAIPRIPVPVPTSRASRGGGERSNTSSIIRRHIRVVSWVPVPNAWPGSTVSTTSPSPASTVSQEGLITIFRPIFRAWKCSFHFSAQPASVISVGVAERLRTGPERLRKDREEIEERLFEGVEVGVPGEIRGQAGYLRRRRDRVRRVPFRAEQLLVVGRPEGTVGDEELGDGVDRLAAGLDGERFPAGHGVRAR